MGEESEIFDEPHGSQVQQNVLQLMGNFSGDGLKPAFQNKDGSTSTEVYLLIQVEAGDLYFVDNVEPMSWRDQMEPELDYGRTRLWKVDASATRKDIKEALKALIPTIERFLAGCSVHVDADGKRRARLSDEAIAIEEGIGIIGKRA